MYCKYTGVLTSGKFVVKLIRPFPLFPLSLSFPHFLLSPIPPLSPSPPLPPLPSPHLPPLPPLPLPPFPSPPSLPLPPQTSSAGDSPSSVKSLLTRWREKVFVLLVQQKLQQMEDGRRRHECKLKVTRGRFSVTRTPL